MIPKNEVPKFSIMAEQVKSDFARFVANEAQKFFKNSFVRC